MAGTLYVAADQDGAVGVFSSAKAMQAALAPYRDAGVKFICLAFPAHGSGPRECYVLPYRRTEAVAYATDDRAQAQEKLEAFVALDLVDAEALDYCTCEIDQIIPAAHRRLTTAQRLLERLAGPAESEKAPIVVVDHCEDSDEYDMCQDVAQGSA